MKKDSLGDNLTRLGLIAQVLNTESDALNQTIVEMDNVLKKLNLGISFWHTWAKTDKGGNAAGYSRVKGKWGLAIKHFEDDPYTEEVWLWQDAPRWMRIEAITVLKEVMAAGIVNGSIMIDRIKIANKKVLEILQEIRGE